MPRTIVDVCRALDATRADRREQVHRTHHGSSSRSSSAWLEPSPLVRNDAQLAQLGSELFRSKAFVLGALAFVLCNSPKLRIRTVWNRERPIRHRFSSGAPTQ
jgi:hypothetical protein